MTTMRQLIEMMIESKFDQTSIHEERTKILPDSLEEYVLVGSQYADPQYIDGVLFYDTTIKTLIAFVKDHKKDASNGEIRNVLDSLVKYGHIQKINHPWGIEVYMPSKRVCRE